MLDAAQFDDLATGDVLEVPGLFHKMTEEPVVMMAVRSLGSEEVRFIVTYFGVQIGTCTCTKKDGVMTWA